MVWVPLPTLVGVYVTLQDPLESAHVVELKVPEPDDENVTVPVGVTFVPLAVSDTVTVHVVRTLTLTEDGEQVTTVDVVRSGAAAVMLNEFELPVWSVSPP